MLGQPNRKVQKPRTAVSWRQRMLEQLDTNEKAIEELSDEQLEAAAGGLGSAAAKHSLKWGMRGGDNGTILGAVTNHGKKLL